MMKKMFFAIAVTTSLVALPALAGNTTLTNAAGDKLRISCKNSGCEVKIKKTDMKKYGRVEKGPGGSANYKKLVAKYKEMGFS